MDTGIVIGPGDEHDGRRLVEVVSMMVRHGVGRLVIRH